MKKHWLRFSFLTVAAAAVTLSACDLADRGAQTPLEPTRAEHAAAKAVQKLPGHVPVHVAGSSAAALIGSGGGTISVAGHVLTVPAGAVSRPTRFTMAVVNDGYVEVELNATVPQSRGPGIDVGEKGFDRPVTLQLNYAWAAGDVDASRLQIVWVKEDGSLETLSSTADSGTKTVTADLDHFSKYAIGQN